MMGMGKTTAMIRHINEAPDEMHFMFCTPLLEQVQRVQAECPRKHFVAPDDSIMSKTEDIKSLIRARHNIATTHALFLRFDDETRKLISESNYTLIVDEAMDALSIYDITKYDTETLLEKYCAPLDNGRLIWTEPSYEGKFWDYKKDIDNGIIYLQNRKTLVRMCRIESFEVFDTVFLMTYLFPGTLCKTYFDLNGWQYKYWYVHGNTRDEYRLSESPVTYIYPNLKELISIQHTFNGSTLTTGGSAFSKSWYEYNASKPTEEFLVLKKHLSSFFRSNRISGCTENMWTTFKDYIPYTKGGGYTKGFVPCNAKATNEYRHKRVLAYPINRYLNPNLRQFINQHGGQIKHNDFALTEMVQWVWRSAIRDNQPIVLYIPSDRMYSLFVKWLNKVSV